MVSRAIRVTCWTVDVVVDLRFDTGCRPNPWSATRPG